MNLIIVNGNITKTWTKEIKKFDIKCLICVDGAANALIENGVIPNVVIGDFDSLNPNILIDYQNQISFIKNSCQNTSDLEKALEHAISENLTQVYLSCIHGNRLDHEFNNLSVLARFSNKIDIKIIEEDSQSVIINANKKLDVEFNCPKDTLISLLPLPQAIAVTSTGLHYPLSEVDLKFGEKLSLSNFSNNQEVSIKITSGKLMIYVFIKSSPGNLIF